MRSECPSCSALFRVSADELRQAMGMVRCARCGTVFNALETLQDPGLARAQPRVSQQAGEPVPRPWREAKGLGGVDSSSRRADRPPRGPGASAVADATGSRSGGLALIPGLATLALALRNLSRQGGRTTLGLSAIALGVVALLLAGGFTEWMFWAMREATIQSRFGHIQVVRPGWFEHGVAEPNAYLLPDELPALAAIRETPHVQVVARRLHFGGLVSRGETTLSFLGEGVEPGPEETVSRQVTLVEGQGLDAADPGGVILGAGLAKSLGAQPGDAVVLLATPAGAGINAVEATVRGVFRTSTKAFDDSVLRVPIELARRLVRVAGSHSWVLLLEDTAATDAVLADLRARFPQDEAGLYLKPWYELADFYTKTRDLLSRQIDVVRLIIALIILLSISNTLIMSVLERTAEIGTLMALGFRRGAILRLFVTEAAALGAAGGALGLALGVAAAAAISAVGIPMPPPPGMDVGFVGEIRLTAPLLTGAFLLAVAASISASVYPAWKASRLEIVDALRRAR